MCIRDRFDTDTLEPLKGYYPFPMFNTLYQLGTWVESTVNGKRFVTARGWDDLSQMIHLYEQNHLPVDEKLIIQYLQNPKIAKEFAVYYDLFNKYRSDYQVDKILAGKATKAIRRRGSCPPGSRCGRCV